MFCGRKIGDIVNKKLIENTTHLIILEKCYNISQNKTPLAKWCMTGSRYNIVDII